MLWKNKGDSSGQEKEQCCGNDGEKATKKSAANQSCCSSSKKEEDEGANRDTGVPEVSVFEFMSASTNKNPMTMTGHCQTGTDSGIQACLWTPGAKGQTGHKIVF